MSIRNRLSDFVFFSILPLSLLVLFIEKRDILLSKFSLIGHLVNSVNLKDSSFVVEFFLMLLLLLLYFLFLYKLMALFITGEKINLFSSFVISVAFSHFLVTFLPIVNGMNILYIYVLSISFLWALGYYFFSKAKDLKSSLYIFGGSVILNGIVLLDWI